MTTIDPQLLGCKPGPRMRVDDTLMTAGPLAGMTVARAAQLIAAVLPRSWTLLDVWRQVHIRQWGMG